MKQGTAGRFNFFDQLLTGDIIEYFDYWINQWHQTAEELPDQMNEILDFARQLVYYNYKLWHEEDQARRMNVSNDVIAQNKRNIDSFNQLRNDTIEKLDRYLLTRLEAEKITLVDNAPMNSETPGNIVDRLSILSLKIYHMHQETLRNDVDNDHIEKASTRELVLKQQRIDLARCLDLLILDLAQGRKLFKLYYQFKMYNNPSTNPELYRVQK